MSPVGVLILESRRLVFLLNCGSPGSAIFTASGRDHGVDGGIECVGGAAGAKVGLELVLDDGVRYGVGQRTFQSIADFDAQRAVGHEDEQHRAVVALFLADTPSLGGPHGEVFQSGAARQARVNGDDELVGRVALELGETCVQGARAINRDVVGVIVEMRRGSRRCRSGGAGGRYDGDERESRERDRQEAEGEVKRAHLAEFEKSNFTSGGVWAEDVAAK